MGDELTNFLLWDVKTDEEVKQLIEKWEKESKMKYYHIIFFMGTSTKKYNFVLVKANSFEEGCEKIKSKVPSASSFQNFTIQDDEDDLKNVIINVKK